MIIIFLAIHINQENSNESTSVGSAKRYKSSILKISYIFSANHCFTLLKTIWIRIGLTFNQLDSKENIYVILNNESCYRLDRL